MAKRDEYNEERIDRALEDGKTFLTVLENLTDGVFVCEPLHAAVKLAKQILEMVEKVRKNTKDCKELARDIFRLMFVIVEILKGKSEEDVPPRLKNRLQDVARTLLDVRTGLGELKLDQTSTFRYLPKALLRRDTVGEKISVYKDRLTSSLRQFHFAITNDIVLDMRAGFNKLEETIRSAGKNTDAPQATTNLSCQVSSVVPRPPAHFLGRDDVVDDVARKLMGTSQQHVALLGTGGIGKTSVALSVLDSELIKSSNHRCCFIRCDSILGAAALVLAILQVLEGKPPTQDGDLMARLVSCLRAAGPVVLVLDNFESPWDTGGARADLTDVLRALVTSPNVQLVVTMRGDAPPAKGEISWTTVFLQPLSLASAKELFLLVNPDTSNEEHRDLGALLEHCGGLPLAINLLASLKGTLPCSSLLRRWQKQSTALLSAEHESANRLTSLDVSISLSLNSTAMKHVPEAMELLAVICQLPDGIKGGIEQLIAMDLGLDDVDTALSVLFSSALAFSAHDGSIQVLSPVRQHVMKHRALTVAQRQGLVRYYIQLVDEHADKEPGHDGFKQAYQTLVPELGNIIHLFRQELGSENVPPGIAQAAFTFTRFQDWSRCSTELIDVLLARWPEYDVRAPYADALASRAKLLMRMGKYMLAHNDLEAALQESTRAGDQSAMARCEQSLGDILRMCNEYIQAIEKLNRALEMFSEVGDKLGIAQCQQSLGDIHCMRDEYDQAIEKFGRAFELFSKIGRGIGAAQCQKSLGEIYRMRHEYTKAIETLDRALESFSSMGDRLGVAQCQQSLGNVHGMRDEHDQAITRLNQALEIFSEIGHRLGEAQCQRSLGNILLNRREYDQAMEKLTRALKIFAEIGHRLGESQCQQSLGEAHRVRCEHDPAREKLTRSLVVFSEIGDRLGAAQCRKSIGSIHCMRNELGPAIEELTRALETFTEIGDQLGVAQCKQGLGDVHVAGKEYEPAIRQFTHALETFSQIGYRLGTLQTLQSLGNIQRIDKQYDDARGSIHRALELASNIGDRYEIAWCRIYLSFLDRDQQHLAEASRNIEMARSQLEEIGEMSIARYCSRIFWEIEEDKLKTMPSSQP